MKAFRIAKVIFLLVGAGMLVGALLLYNSTSRFLEGAIRANGEVVDLVESRSSSASSSDSPTYRPVVRFTTMAGEGVEFTSSVGSNPPSYSRGEQVQVLYRADEPTSGRIDDYMSLWGGATIVAGLGTVFFLIGAGMMIGGRLRNRSNEQLRLSGTPVKAEFQRVELNESFSMNGRHPFRIVAQWHNPSTAKVYVFTSSNVWFDPTSYVKAREITVFLDGGNPKRYYVDLSFLPELAE